MNQSTHLKDVHFRSRARFAAYNEDENIVVHFDWVVAGEGRRLLDECRGEALDDVLKRSFVSNSLELTFVVNLLQFRNP